MCYLAGKFVKKLKKRQPELLITESDVLCVQIAALSYNLGFGPFSYLFNDWFLKEIETNWKVLLSNYSKIKFPSVIQVLQL